MATEILGTLGPTTADLSLRSVGSFLSTSGAMVVGAGVATKMLGSYSGRLASEDSLDAQLGIVWPMELIDTIGLNGKIDIFTLHGAFTPKSVA